jgi:hypothetical protein
MNKLYSEIGEKIVDIIVEKIVTLCVDKKFKEAERLAQKILTKADAKNLIKEIKIMIAEDKAREGRVCPH